ncbi:phage tail assembly chaperone [Streptomyces asiaticus]|uniref:phage tail assembly chaperone n=1 Tax=Streptomyces asiaticus TaxID=114695 RepID=UPI001BACC9DF|nr:phage tail assembly chaperone [Streptomyces asiaticus]
MALSRDGILGAVDIKTEKVPVPEWGGEVIIRGLTGEELDNFQGSVRQFRPSLDGKGMEAVLVQDNMRAKLLVKCIVDEAGERLFTDQDASALGAKNGSVIDRLYDVASALSGLSEEEKAELEGNSEAATDDSSTSSSPETSSTAP